MASQSPQRARKAVPSAQGPAQANVNVRREASPSPSLREREREQREQQQQQQQRDPRQRYVRTQSMPVVPPSSSSHIHTHMQAQAQAHANAHAAAHELVSTGVGVATTNGGGLSDPLQIGYPRPIPLSRVTQPQFFHHGSSGGVGGVAPVGVGHAEKWQMTEDLQADIERADLLQQQVQQQQQHQQRQMSISPGPQPAPGTAGVAYAGGAVSAGPAFVGGGHMKTHSSGSVGAGSGDAVEGAAARRRASATEQAQHRASPLSYALRKAANTSPGYPSMPSPRSAKNRTPDRSLPVQEEPDEHEQVAAQTAMTTTTTTAVTGTKRVSPAPSSELNPTNDLDHEHDAEGTLVDLGDDDDDDGAGGGGQQQQQRPNGESTEGEGSGTPRSPSVALFQQAQAAHVQRGIHEVLQPDKQQQQQQNGKGGGGGSFNPADFQSTLRKLQSESASMPPMHPPPPPFSRTDFSRNESRGSYPNWMFDFYHNYNYPEEMEYYDEAAAYMQQYGAPPPPGPTIATQGMSMHMRPDAPIPPTPHSQTSAPTPFYYQQQQQQQQQNGNGDKGNEGEDGDGDGARDGQQNNESPQRPLAPPFSPAPPSGTPYPYPFSHVRRGFVYPAPPPPVPRVPSSVYDYDAASAAAAAVQEQLRLQMQLYAYNNGALSDSTFSNASTPYPGMSSAYSPFGAYLNQSRAFAAARARAEVAAATVIGGGGGGEDGRVTAASMRSSPSHMPVPLPSLVANGGRGRGLKKRERFPPNVRGKANGNGNGNGTVRRRVKPPPRVESTQPRETSPELSSSGEETAGEKYDHEHREHAVGNGLRSASAGSGEWPNGVGNEDEESGEWVDEEEDEEEEDLLDLDFHPTYVMNLERRRKRWDQRWEELSRAFRALDRETDSTLILLASPSHTSKLHSLSSRSIRRDVPLSNGHAIHATKRAFEQIAAQRRLTRNQHRASLLERLYSSSASSVSSQTGGEAGGGAGDEAATAAAAGEREEDLRRMLRTALHSLGALHTMYEEREARWRMEERRMRDEREGVELLVQQAFGSPPGVDREFS